MNRKNLFCRSLSDWWMESPWGYVTLLSKFIEVVENLPPDIDKVVNKMLLRFPVRPDSEALEKHLREDAYIKAWFGWRENVPKISRFNLASNRVLPEVAFPLPRLETESDLAAWLGLSRGELIWLAGLMRADKSDASNLNHYHYKVIPKRRGGFRLLESPKRLLKDVQRQINSEILRYASIDSAAQGYRRGGSCITHASHHVGKVLVFAFDLKHFFPCISWYQVYRQFLNMGYNKHVSRHLAGLCTHQATHESILPKELGQHERRLAQLRHLPQGAPTSPMLSNAVCLQLDRRLAGLAKSLKLSYSRYADDLAFSGNVERDWSFLEPLVGSICIEEGFELNHRKTRRTRESQRQKITGVVVNEKANIDRRYYDQLKAIIHNCERHGLASQNIDGHSNFYAYLVGRVNYVSQLNPHKGNKLRIALEKLDPLS